jgi:hypothetical protein
VVEVWRGPAAGKVSPDAMSSFLSRTAACALLVWLLPSTAVAEWHFMPWVGLKFATAGDFVDPDLALGQRKTSWGATVRMQGDGILGFEADFAFVPAFFQAERAVPNVTASGVTTLMGNVVLATPLRLTGDSLRPYLSGGAGLLRTRADTIPQNVYPELNQNMLGFSLGGGAVGFLSERAGVRWDIRYFRTAGGGGDPLALDSTWLSFWRANMSLVIRP